MPLRKQKPFLKLPWNVPLTMVVYSGLQLSFFLSGAVKYHFEEFPLLREAFSLLLGVILFIFFSYTHSSPQGGPKVPYNILPSTI